MQIMQTEQEFRFPSSDGIHSCHARVWLPEGTPRAVVQLVHGVSEHIGRYDRFARWLASHGYAVCGHDHLGHGKTAAEDGSFGRFPKYDGWTLVTADVRALRERMGADYPDLPYVLLGHSMGSFLVRTYLCRYPGTVSGAVLSGTGQESALLVNAGKLLCDLTCALRGHTHFSPLVYSLSLGAYNKAFQPSRTANDWLSRDEAVVDDYLADPHCAGKASVGLMREMMGGLKYISSRRALSQMDKTTPVYLFSGDRDPVGQMGEGVKKVFGYFKDAGCTDVTVKLYPGGRHEMLNETNQQEVWADVLTWLEEHV